MTAPACTALAPEAMRWWHIVEVAALDADVFGPERWSVPMFWNELGQAASRYYLISCTGGTIAGYAGLAAYPHEAWVQTIGVRTDHQRRGIGARLLDALLAEADRRGATPVLLEVATGNVSATRLYTRYGFAPVRIRRGYYQNSGEDAMEMRRG